MSGRLQAASSPKCELLCLCAPGSDTNLACLVFQPVLKPSFVRCLEGDPKALGVFSVGQCVGELGHAATISAVVA